MIRLSLTEYSAPFQEKVKNMYIGFDTSNYTTSLALFDGENIYQAKKLLEVKCGERGLRQSDAVFQHTVNIPVLLRELNFSGNVDAVAVSIRPRNTEGSYMPCFLVGENSACCVSKFADVPLYRTSHQVGHILAALYSVGRLELINENFIAFHVSGGTTEALLVTPDSDELMKADIIAQSTDLKAGQAIDRTGVMLGLKFPCGAEIDKLAQNSDKEYGSKPSMAGMNCSLSGVENKVKKMIDDKNTKEDVAKFVLSSVSSAIEKMTENILNKYGNLPIVYAGGVMSNTLIRHNICRRFCNYDINFADSEFSCDNACGIAIFGYLRDKK